VERRSERQCLVSNGRAQLATSHKPVQRLNSDTNCRSSARHCASHCGEIDAASGARNHSETLLGAAPRKRGGECQSVVISVAGANNRDGWAMETRLRPGSEEQRRRVVAQTLLDRGRIRLVGSCDDPNATAGQPLDLERQLATT
jgi:hypothetical protein